MANERSVTEPFIKIDEKQKAKRDSKSNYELKSIIIENSNSAEKEKRNSSAKSTSNSDSKLEPSKSNTKENAVSAKKSKETSGNNVSKDVVIDNDDDSDLDEYDPDLLITEEERQAFEYMLSQKREEMDKREELFEKWVDSITRRRMFALSRIRKLGIAHSERLKFYGSVGNYVKEVESSLNSMSTSSASEELSNGVSSASEDLSNGVDTQSKDNKEKVEVLSRQDTIHPVKDKTVDIDNSSSSTDENIVNEKTNVKAQTNQVTPVVVPVES